MERSSLKSIGDPQVFEKTSRQDTCRLDQKGEEKVPCKFYWQEAGWLTTYLQTHVAFHNQGMVTQREKLRAQQGELSAPLKHSQGTPNQ